MGFVQTKSNQRYLIVLKIIGIGVYASYLYFNFLKKCYRRLKKIIPNYNSNYYSFMI